MVLPSGCQSRRHRVPARQAQPRSASYSASRPMRRRCRASPLKGVSRKVRTSSKARAGSCCRAPMETTLASLCSRPNSAVDSFQARIARRDLLAVPRSSEDDSQASGIGNDRFPAFDAHRRVVVEGVVFCRPVIDDVVARLGEPGDEIFLQFEPCVVRRNVYAHGRHGTGHVPPASGTCVSLAP